MTSNIFHAGETDIQKKAGVEPEYIERVERAVRPYMPDQHRQFFESLPMMVVGAIDNEGRPWASAMFGEDGFITSPSQNLLNIKAAPLMHEAMQLQWGNGAKLGLLGLQVETRRRNRMNGYVNSYDDGELQISVDQSFGNCPQYIQKRTLKPNLSLETADLDVDTVFSDDAQKLIRNANTFFISSRTADIDKDPRSGVDVSHRGGNPGFVKILSDNEFIIPDFSGNKFYNTLGNIKTDNRVGLWFPEFETGDSLFLTGTADVIWDEQEVSQFEGAQRLIKVQAKKIMFGKSILPLIGEVDQYSPFLKKTGAW